MNILIVDDSKAMRTIVIRTLRQAGYGDHSMTEAVNGADALAQIESNRPDLVLSDWNMPEMTGIELLEALIEKDIRVKFGFVTAEGNPQMRRQAMEAGALFLIAKPFTSETFKQTLDSVLSSTNEVPTQHLMHVIPTSRVPWDEYFMNIAKVAGTRSTCDRKQVGAIIVRDKTILSTGYNGSLRGLPHCDEVGHTIENDHCVRTIHAEQNAIIHAARYGISIDGGSIYVTASPCWSCFKSIANAGLRRIVYGEFYRDDRSFRFAAALGIDLRYLPLVS